jgi:hypothetical protein
MLITKLVSFSGDVKEISLKELAADVDTRVALEILKIEPDRNRDVSSK